MENNTKIVPGSELQNESIKDDVLASRWARLAAALLDCLIILPITLPLVYFTGGFDGISEGVEPTLLYTLCLSLIGIVLFILIHGKLLINKGQTIGKKLLGIKIVNVNGNQADLATLTRRYGAYWLFPLIPVVGGLINLINICFIFGSSKRCLHDHFGNTKVINLETSIPTDNKTSIDV